MKILHLSFFILLNSLLYSQGNLQFNQVISGTTSVSGGQNGITYNSSNTYTVPPGKVWKVESVSFQTFSLNGSYAPRVFLILNGVQVLSNIGNTATQSGTLNIQPLWFKAGDVLTFGMLNNCATSCSQSANFLISIIEFNIIPE